MSQKLQTIVERLRFVFHYECVGRNRRISKRALTSRVDIAMMWGSITTIPMMRCPSCSRVWNFEPVIHDRTAPRKFVHYQSLRSPSTTFSDFLSEQRSPNLSLSYQFPPF
ncbi:hypothetical protein AVEN_269318-1 [Araneus ventricosus]|uniref:Uncharacterized protein n=1 Tax=Araneus ventricosus TaxID=182803 RepID=A0A4Y2I371_ARAVE|nr:hypothetical protein AVEN_269318-1 [Araneus ventricosus]